MITQELLLRHPALVRTATIGCSWAGGPTGVMPQTSHEIVAAIASRDVERVLRVGYAANLSARYRAHPARFAAYREAALAVRVPSPVVGMQFQAALAHDTADRLPTITTPTLVLHGTADEGIVSANSERIAALIPGARLVLFDGVGHLFWFEEPDRTVELLGELTKADQRGLVVGPNGVSCARCVVLAHLVCGRRAHCGVLAHGAGCAGTLAGARCRIP
jgi:pimeloyl-ACP methyl ester carboxylesterase